MATQKNKQKKNERRKIVVTCLLEVLQREKTFMFYEDDALSYTGPQHTHIADMWGLGFLFCFCLECQI